MRVLVVCLLLFFASHVSGRIGTSGKKVAKQPEHDAHIAPHVPPQHDAHIAPPAHKEDARAQPAPEHIAPHVQPQHHEEHNAHKEDARALPAEHIAQPVHQEGAHAAAADDADIGVTPAPPAKPVDLDMWVTIAKGVRRMVSDKTPADFASTIKENLRLLFFFTDFAKNEYIPEITKLDKLILEEEVNLKTYLRKIAECAGQNGYLNTAFHGLVDYFHTGHFKFVNDMIAQPPKEQIFQVVALSMTMDRLARVCRNNRHVLLALDGLWRTNIQRPSSTELVTDLEWFALVKAVTVMASFRAIRDGLATEKLDWDNMKTLLPLNIYEAAYADYQNGYIDNTITGVTLATHKHGKKVDRAHTGEGPARRVVDPQNQDSVGLHWKLPLSRFWANLYHTWNADFVMEEFPSGLVIGAKLWNPQVMCLYQQSPGEYMLNRGVALYGMLMFLGHLSLREAWYNKNDPRLPAEERQKFSTREHLLFREAWTGFTWDQDARLKWGAANKRSAEDYNARVERAKGMAPGYKWKKVMDNYETLAASANGCLVSHVVSKKFSAAVDSAKCFMDSIKF